MPDIEQRRAKRIFFCDMDSIEADVATGGHSRVSFQARVLNLSEDGIFITVAPLNIPPDGFNAGTHLILRTITGITPALEIDDVRMEVRWLFQNQLMDHVGLGCKFLQMSADTKKQLRCFVNVALEKVK